MTHGNQQRLIIKLGIATAGRRSTLSDTAAVLAEQTRQADELIVCPSRPADCDEARLAQLGFPARVVVGERGTSAQRNAILEQCGTCDVMLFLDDDFYPSRNYLAVLEQVFLQQPEIVGLTGRVLADGAVTAGISHSEALAILASHWRDSQHSECIESLYGCNMAVRMQPVRERCLRFDENLPLYGWLEDVDFSRRLGRDGWLIKSHALTGVHLAVKRGRSSGVSVGYSQIANPLYLMGKGTMPPRSALVQLGRNVAANAYRMVRPEPWVDRRGRLRGNVMATLDLFRGRLDPRRITALPK
jgi:GT2 family glycosyltransferase